MSRKTQRRHQTYKHPVHKPKTAVKPPIDYMWHNVEAFLKAGQSITPYQETMLARYAEMAKTGERIDFDKIPHRSRFIEYWDEAAPIPASVYDELGSLPIPTDYGLSMVAKAPLLDRLKQLDVDKLQVSMGFTVDEAQFIEDWDEPPMPSREPITIEESIQHLADMMRKQSGVKQEAGEDDVR